MPDKDYSQRDVTDKLGLKPGHGVRVVGHGDAALLARVREKVGRRLGGGREPADVVLYWPRAPVEITPTLLHLAGEIAPAGGIWVITAKRGQISSSGMEYFNQDQLISLGKAAGLVDNKICSLSERESAMRFVIRKKDRRE